MNRPEKLRVSLLVGDSDRTVDMVDHAVRVDFKRADEDPCATGSDHARELEENVCEAIHRAIEEFDVVAVAKIVTKMIIEEQSDER